MTRLTKMSAAALAAALLVPGMVAADGDDAVGSAAFESLAVEAGAGSITVTGVSTFGGEELVVGVDAAGDGAVPGLGTDTTQVSIVQDPSSGLIEIALATDLAAPASAPGLTWGVSFSGSSLNAPQLLAFSTDESGVPGSFQFGIGTGGGVNEDFGVASVDGRVEGNSFIWSVTPSQIGVEPGARISPDGGGFSTTGGRNLAVIFVGGTNIDELAVTESFTVGGGARVKVLDAAGEEVDEKLAKVRRGEFSVTIDELPAGAYTVEVTTGYADGSTTESFPVTVA